MNITLKRMETINQNNIDLIEQFLEGNLSKEEQHKFNNLLESDKKFADLYRFRLKIREDLQKAKQYEKTGKLVAGTIKNVQRKKRRNTIYAIAAGLALLIAIPGIFTIVNKLEQNNLAKVDSTNTELFTPQIKQPESFANQGHYVPDALTLTVIQTNDSVIFQWQPAVDKPSKLVIIKQANGFEVFNSNINANAQRITLSNDKLPSGKIIWYIEGFAARDSFKIYPLK
jgi:hypothetical protein